MRRMISLLLLVLFPVFNILNNTNYFTAQKDDAVSEPISADDWEFFQQFDEDFDRRLNIAGCPGAAVAVVKNDQIIFLRGYGKQKYGRKDEVNTETIFRIGSLSKGFAGLLTSKLVSEGFLTWEDKVQDIIPEFDLKNHDQAKRINIQHLMSHSTGLQRHAYTDLTESGLPVDKIIPVFKNLNDYGREGQYYAYQNSAFSMIEEIIRQKTGKSYNDLLYEKIFLPAQMEHVSTDYHEISSSDNVALPHVLNYKNQCIPVRLNKKYYNAVSAGGVNASIKDMASWLRILLGNRPDIIAPESLEFIFSPHVKNPDRRAFYGWGGVENNYYGIGWRIVNWPDHSIVYHGGSVNGYRSEIAIDRKNNIGICVLFSSNNSYANQVIPDFFRDYNSFFDNKKEFFETTDTVIKSNSVQPKS
ncbi:MAG: beta-lactamase family protein [Saprospiraceae bacterium]|nr:beta-lactamase family protein [Saprospiraceae bacterium]